MNLKITRLVSVFAFGLAGASFARAADETISAVMPADSPPSDAPAKKGGDGKRMQGMLEQRLKQLDENLKLTDDQKQKIKDIWAKQADELKNLSPEERRSKGREALKAAHDQIRALLTEEQQAKFDTMKPDGRSGKGQGKKDK